MSPAREISKYLGRWPIALVACLLLGAAVLLPALGKPGLWDPQERQLADRIAPPRSIQLEQDAAKAKAKAAEAAEAAKAAEQAKPTAACKVTAPEDPIARTLSRRAIVWARDNVGDSDGGRRLPLALLGMLTVLATAGIAFRTGGARAGVIAAVVLVSMPLLVLQSRMLTSDIGTACGATLVIYGFFAISAARGVVHAIRWRRGAAAIALATLDTLVGIAALGAGLAIGFVAGGALLGLLVPIGAFAAAGKLGVPAITGAARTAADGFRWLATQVRPRRAIGRARRVPGPVTTGSGAALLATLLAIGLVALLAYQLYELKDPYPGIVPPARQVFGKAIVPEGCWSWLLGAIWRPEDDLRFIYDSSFEQIAYGTFPWGVLGPVAMLVLLRDRDPRKRLAGALALAWAGGAWIATEAFQRKVGFTIYGGFPALALAIGVWLDGVLARRTATPATADTVEASVAEPVVAEPAGPPAPIVERRSAVPAGAFLLALFVALAVLDLGKDLQSFPEKLTSLLAGESIAYPTQTRFFGLPTKLWVLVLGMLAALGFVTTLVVWRTGESAVATTLRRIARWGLAVSLGASIALAAFWSYGWQPRLAEHLSSKAMFETYRELRQPADRLVMMGDLGHAPLAYADTTPEKVQTREQIVTALKRPDRVFAIAPQAELCSLHREIGDKPYFVVDDRNTRNLLLSNRVDGTTDKNPLASMIAHVAPKQIQYRPKGSVIWDNKIELLGWSIPKTVRRSTKFEVTLYYKILAPVGGNWTSIMHFDGAIRFSGDHKPIKDRCPTSTWQPGDYIIDRTTVVAGGAGHPLGRYDLWIGFFTGSAPNFRNMTISTAPGDIRDTTDRVKITSVILD